MSNPSPVIRQPVFFLGHGSPMNAIEDNPYRSAWQGLGQEFGPQGRWPKPRAVLCVSAHWTTRGWSLTGMAQPRTLHDFGGFPPALFEQQYPAPGDPALAAALALRLRQPHDQSPLQLDLDQWGLDHGCWGVLKPMFPQADIAVLQLSIDVHQAGAMHLALGRQLAALRDEGVLIVASGNLVHNLTLRQSQASDQESFEWAMVFDDWVCQHLAGGDAEQLARPESLGALYLKAHPTPEHYLPFLYAVGARRDDEPLVTFNEGWQMASIGMRSFIWG
jgi:4,5-DOPA dioxygenase extradiol